jgi:hypothetical protein
MKKIYVGISRDHSGSMGHLRGKAAADYNQNIQALRDASLQSGQDTIVSVVSCGIYDSPSIHVPYYGRRASGGVRREVVNSSVNALKPIQPREYIADGQTPLFDSVGELIDMMKSMPDANDPDVIFLIMVITDGQENASAKWKGRQLGDEIMRLQFTDRWTFTFRVPRGGARALEMFGIPQGNIMEWEQSERGFEQATHVTTRSIGQFYSGAAAGQRSSSSFYASTVNTSPVEVERTLDDISAEVTLINVGPAPQQIRPCIESLMGVKYRLGQGFYELTKPEDVQSYKQVLLRDMATHAVYAGDHARQLIGLPVNTVGTVRLHPEHHRSRYKIFVQSTSVNRKLMPNTTVVYWPNAVMTRH